MGVTVLPAYTVMTLTRSRTTPCPAAYSEEEFADESVGKPIQPLRIEEGARKIKSTNFIVAGRFKPHAVRDGNLITASSSTREPLPRIW